jgi:histidine phosphatase superfamily protein (branch 1)
VSKASPVRQGEVHELRYKRAEVGPCGVTEFRGGECLTQVAARAQAVIERASSASGNTLVFAYGHVLRILVCCWLGLPPEAGQLFALSTATVASTYLLKPAVTRRNTQVHFIQPLKERVVREAGYGLALEGASAADLVKSMTAQSQTMGGKGRVA